MDKGCIIDVRALRNQRKSNESLIEYLLNFHGLRTHIDLLGSFSRTSHLYKGKNHKINMTRLVNKVLEPFRSSTDNKIHKYKMVLLQRLLEFQQLNYTLTFIDNPKEKVEASKELKRMREKVTIADKRLRNLHHKKAVTRRGNLIRIR